jgi:uncharacterized membrane protein
MAKIPKVLFVIGLILLVLGIVLVIASPSFTKITWEQKEKSIEKTFSLLSRWKSQEKSDILVNDELITVKPYYSEWSGKWSSTYDYWFCLPSLIYGEAKNIVISWNAKEISNPSKIFNFYVFDKKNFELWKENFSSTAYYVGKGSNTYNLSLTFSKKEELPDSFYYVVEVPSTELNPKASEEELKRVVEVNAVANYVEVSERLKTEYEDFYLWPPIINVSEVRNIVLEGSIKEGSNNSFNFYIFDDTNFKNFDLDKPYSSYYEKEGISEDSFSVPLKPEQAKSNIYFVIVNTSNYNETIKLLAKIRYEEKVVDASASVGAFFLGGVLAGLGFILIIVAGVSTLIFKSKGETKTEEKAKEVKEEKSKVEEKAKEETTKIWEVQVKAKNTEPFDVIISDIMINGISGNNNKESNCYEWIKGKVYISSISIDGENKARTLPVKIRVGSTAEFKIAVKIEEPPVQIGSTKLTSGTKLNIVLHSSTGKDYPVQATLL